MFYYNKINNQDIKGECDTEYTEKTKQDIITSKISTDTLFGQVLHFQSCG